MRIEMIMIVWRKSSFSANGGDCVEVSWRKSSFSSNGGDCVEVAWRKSSFSANGGSCLEVNWPGLRVAVRDSKNTAGPAIEFPHTGWRAMVANLQR